MSVHLPREEVSTVLKLAREVALQLDADSNSDEDYAEVRLLGAVEALDPDRVLVLPDGIEDLWNPEYAELISLA